MVPLSATQRGCFDCVPRITTRCGSSCSVSSTGTVPPRKGSVSDQWKAMRKKAQHAPQLRQGWAMGRTEGAPPGARRADSRAWRGPAEDGWRVRENSLEAVVYRAV